MQISCPIRVVGISPAVALWVGGVVAAGAAGVAGTEGAAGEGDLEAGWEGDGSSTTSPAKDPTIVTLQIRKSSYSNNLNLG